MRQDCFSFLGRGLAAIAALTIICSSLSAPLSLPGQTQRSGLIGLRHRVVAPGLLNHNPDLSKIAVEALKKFNVPGLCLGVVQGGRVVHVAPAGVRQLGVQVPIERDDRFHLGSCAKLMTSLMIYRLIDQHKITLNTTLGKVLEGVDMLPVYRSVTIRELLQFKGGIAPYLLIAPTQTPEVFDEKGRAEQQRARFVAHVLRERPSATPGTKAVYSNADYAVLAHLASKITGKSWERLMTENVFIPLGMTHSGFGRPRSASNSNAPSGHVQTGNGWKPEPIGYVHPASLSAAGDINASLSDFGLFAAEELRIAQDKSRLLSRKTAALMRSNSNFESGKTILGGAGAFTAGITLWPSDDFAAVVAANSGGAEQLCVTVSAALKKAYVDQRPLSIVATKSKRSYGLMLGLGEQGTVVVGSVLIGSIASEAGLQSGDVVTAINNMPIDKLPDEQRFAALRSSPLILRVNRACHLLEIYMKLG